MSNLEICDALYSDLPKLKIRANTQIPKFAKQFKKDGKFPAWKWEEYTHQESRNRYLISFYAPAVTYVEKPFVNYVAFMDVEREQLVVQWGCWEHQRISGLGIVYTRYVGYYSSHFFRRYRERMWKDEQLSKNEIISRFFSRNRQTIPLHMNEGININYKEYGEYAKYAFQVPDGVCFIRHWNEGDESTIEQRDSSFISVVCFLTFVSRGMMTDNQNLAISKEGTRYIQSYYKRLFEDAVRESFFPKKNTHN